MYMVKIIITMSRGGGGSKGQLKCNFNSYDNNILYALKNDLTSCYCTFFCHPHLTPGTMSVQVHVCTREWCTTQETAGMTDATSAASVTTRWRACTLVLTGQSFGRLFAGLTSSSSSSSSRSMQPHFLFRLVCCLFWLWCPCVFMTLTLRPSVIDRRVLDL